MAGPTYVDEQAHFTNTCWRIIVANWSQIRLLRPGNKHMAVYIHV